MKVLIYVEDVIGVHYATNLEIAVEHLHRGDEVYLVTCHGTLQSCPGNSRHDWKTCVLCRSKLRAGLAIHALTRAKQHVLDLDRFAGQIRLPRFASIDEVKCFTIDGVNHGMEAASSVISALRDPKPDMQTHRLLVERSLFTSVALYRAMLELICSIQPDLCYILNGRRASQMPAVRAAQNTNVRFYTFEVGHSWQKYILTEGTYFHDLAGKKREIESYWKDKVSREEKERIAHRFFHDRRYGAGDKYPEAEFRKNQHKGRLPDRFDPAKRAIAVFNSSEDEFAAVEGYGNPVYKDQMEGLRRIINAENICPDIRFYLRVHPNLGEVRNYQTHAIAELQADNLVIIGPKDDVDSYALMEASEKVITFGSAMSIESAYAGKPSILIGREPYEDLGSCYTPRTHDEVVTLIYDRELPALSRVGALKYGYYMVARDRDYQHFNPETNTFDGRVLAPSEFARRAIMILRVGPLNYIKNRFAYYGKKLVGQEAAR